MVLNAQNSIPPWRKSTISLHGAHQLIVKSKELSKQQGWIVQVFTVQINWNVYTLRHFFSKSLFFISQTHTLSLLREKFEIIMSNTKRAVTMYKKAQKIDPICLFSTHRGTCHKLCYYCEFWPNFSTQCT